MRRDRSIKKTKEEYMKQDVNLDRLLADLQQLAGAVHDNAPDMEDDGDIAAEYTLLVAVHTTMQTAEDYFRVTQ